MSDLILGQCDKVEEVVVVSTATIGTDGIVLRLLEALCEPDASLWLERVDLLPVLYLPCRGIVFAVNNIAPQASLLAIVLARVWLVGLQFPGDGRHGSRQLQVSALGVHIGSRSNVVKLIVAEYEVLVYIVARLNLDGGQHAHHPVALGRNALVLGYLGIVFGLGILADKHARASGDNSGEVLERYALVFLVNTGYGIYLRGFLGRNLHGEGRTVSGIGTPEVDRQCLVDVHLRPPPVIFPLGQGRRTHIDGRRGSYKVGGAGTGRIGTQRVDAGELLGVEKGHRAYRCKVLGQHYILYLAIGEGVTAYRLDALGQIDVLNGSIVGKRAVANGRHGIGGALVLYRLGYIEHGRGGSLDKRTLLGVVRGGSVLQAVDRKLGLGMYYIARLYQQESNEEKSKFLNHILMVLVVRGSVILNDCTPKSHHGLALSSSDRHANRHPSATY